MKRISLLAIVAALVGGCATVSVREVRQDLRTQPGTVVLLDNVPYHRQHGDECGPAALAMVAGYWGERVRPAEIAAAIYRPQLHGTLNIDLADYATRIGLWTRQYRGSIADLRQKLQAGVPLLVQARVPVPFVNAQHYWVVIGYDEVRRVLIAHSGLRPYETLPVARFERLWRRDDYWTLLACRPDGARWDLSAGEHNDLALYFERASQPDRAEAEYRRGLSLAPTNAWLHFNLGNALLAQHCPAEAAASYRQAYALNPGNSDFCNNLAYALAESGSDLAEAAQLAHRAIDLNPAGQASYLDTLGFVYVRQADYPLARHTLEQALGATTDRQMALREEIRKRMAALPPAPAPP